MIPAGFLQEIAEKAVRDGGVSADMQALKTVGGLDEWLFPRWPDLTTVVPEKRLAAALAEFTAAHRGKLTADVYLGVWRHDGKYYIDLNAHAPSVKDAASLARTYSAESKRDIISAYNPAQDKTYYF